MMGPEIFQYFSLSQARSDIWQGDSFGIRGARTVNAVPKSITHDRSLWERERKGLYQSRRQAMFLGLDNRGGVMFLGLDDLPFIFKNKKKKCQTITSKI